MGDLLIPLFDDSGINSLFALGDSCGLICDGADASVSDEGVLTEATNGGLLFGDGGNGIDGSAGGDGAAPTAGQRLAATPGGRPARLRACGVSPVSGSIGGTMRRCPR